MPCIEYEDLILEYCEGALGAGEFSRAEAHLAACPECRSFFELQRELDHALARVVGKPAPSAAFRQNLMRRVEAESRARLRWVPVVLDVIGYTSVAAIGGVVLSVTVPLAHASWVAVAAYAAAGIWLGFRILREGRLPGER